MKKEKDLTAPEKTNAKRPRPIDFQGVAVCLQARPVIDIIFSIWQAKTHRLSSGRSCKSRGEPSAAVYKGQGQSELPHKSAPEKLHTAKAGRDALCGQGLVMGKKETENLLMERGSFRRQ